MLLRSAYKYALFFLLLIAIQIFRICSKIVINRRTKEVLYIFA